MKHLVEFASRMHKRTKELEENTDSVDIEKWLLTSLDLEFIP